ncbi:MAG: hypothetical protein L0H37_07395, partial [Nitrosospira sp.]|nr:hypothetical protein [Nitrosospira sp.]
GVSKSSQIAYEMGRTLPSVPYLKKLALAGVNVVYLLTGKELTPIDPDGQLRSLIDSWLRLAPENRDALEQYAGFLVVTTTDSVETPEEAEKWLRESDKVLHALREGRPIPDPS